MSFWECIIKLMWDFLPWMRPKKEEIRVCFCGSGKPGEDCHELEHELSQHEKPDPDYN